MSGRSVPLLHRFVQAFDYGSHGLLIEATKATLWTLRVHSVDA